MQEVLQESSSNDVSLKPLIASRIHGSSSFGNSGDFRIRWPAEVVQSPKQDRARHLRMDANHMLFATRPHYGLDSKGRENVMRQVQVSSIRFREVIDQIAW